MIGDDIKSVLINEEQLKECSKRLGAEISKDYENREIIVLIILKGSMVFASDLIREITVPVKLDFMQVSSYGNGTESSGIIKIKKDMENDAAGKHILIIEDIVDSGKTLFNVRKMLEERGAASVGICTLLSKPERHEVDVKVEYIGMEIPDEFVVGYGLDFSEKYRNLPYVGILKPQVYVNIK